MLPLLFLVPSVLAGGVGVVAGVSASDKNQEAKNISEKSKKKLERASKKIDSYQNHLNRKINTMANFKIDIFKNQIRTLVEMSDRCKNTNSKYISERIKFTKREIRLLKVTIDTSLKLSYGAGKGAMSGALTAFGVYGTVGAFASASTSTAIATLSGIAAENATLAWLGGGAISAGGGGIALGTTVLTGLLAGPFIGVFGLNMNSKANKNLTKAKRYEAEVEIAIKKINLKIKELNAISKAIDELNSVLERIIKQFNRIEFNLRYLSFRQPCKQKAFKDLLIVGRGLKDLLELSILDKNGKYNVSFKRELREIKW